MNQVLKDFQDATRETYNRYTNSGMPSGLAEETTKAAIILALHENFYNGFTRQNDARSKVEAMSKEDIEYALLYNAISMMDYKHQKGYSFGNIDSFIISITSHCQQKSFDELRNLLKVGISEFANEQRYIQSHRMTDTDQINEYKSYMAEIRKSRNVTVSSAYKYVDCLISGYVVYNAHYNDVSCETPIETLYDMHAADNLTAYYEAISKVPTSGIRK